jgi:GNAT superfamily N-acetyltransferase
LPPRRRTEQGSILEVVPATADRWPDLVELFTRPGPRGGKPVTDGCWCMFWRLRGPEFDYGWGRGDGSGNRTQMRKLVADGVTPGLIAYVDGKPVAWCSLGPRESFVRLERSTTLARVDDKPVWSIVCFYIHGSYKRRGIGAALLDAAVKYARSQGARIVEGYPVQPGNVDPFTGFESMFRAAGFRVARPGKGKGRRIVRRSIAASRSTKRA